MYFSNFPTTYYEFNDDIKRKVVDLTAFSKLGTSLLDDVTFYSFYDIQDGERPDQVSQKLYGSPEYYWTFFLLNANIKNVYDDWPRSSIELQEYLTVKYPDQCLLTNDDISQKFEIGETVFGQISGALGKVSAKYPSNGYMAVRPITQGVFKVDLTSGGSGYTTIPAVKIVGNGSGATARAEIAYGSVSKIIVTNVGSGYTTATVQITGGGGSGAAAQITYPETDFKDLEALQGVESEDTITIEKVLDGWYAPAYWLDLSDDTVTMKQKYGSKYISRFDQELEANITKSKIRVIKPEYIGRIAEEFKREMLA